MPTKSPIEQIADELNDLLNKEMNCLKELKTKLAETIQLSRDDTERRKAHLNEAERIKRVISKSRIGALQNWLNSFEGLANNHKKEKSYDVKKLSEEIRKQKDVRYWLWMSGITTEDGRYIPLA